MSIRSYLWTKFDRQTVERRHSIATRLRFKFAVANSSESGKVLLELVRSFQLEGNVSHIYFPCDGKIEKTTTSTSLGYMQTDSSHQKTKSDITFTSS